MQLGSLLFSESLFTVFSTTTTDESTSIPIAITKPPKLIKFADMEKWLINIKVARAATGKDIETISAALKLPRNKASNMITSTTA